MFDRSHQNDIERKTCVCSIPTHLSLFTCQVGTFHRLVGSGYRRRLRQTTLDFLRLWQGKNLQVRPTQLFLSVRLGCVLLLLSSIVVAFRCWWSLWTDTKILFHSSCLLKWFQIIKRHLVKIYNHNNVNMIGIDEILFIEAWRNRFPKYILKTFKI